MPTYKSTLVFSTSSDDGRRGSWTETFYTVQSNGDAARGVLAALALRRCALLPSRVSLDGFRITDVLNPGVTAVGKFGSLSGTATDQQADIPQMALSVDLRTDSGRVRSFEMPGIPDGQVTGGAYTPTGPFKTVVAQYLNTIVGGSWYMKCENQTFAREPVVKVETDGVITMVNSDLYLKGDFIRFYRTKDNSGQTVKGDWRIAAKLTATTYQLISWPISRYVSGGLVKKTGLTFLPITSFFINGVCTRKIGAPLFRYRGRASKRT